ncbi:hypothetical protein [Bosea rubneri]|uniref:Uncharacterized protein n=1 Tax=Bosea rubneri TaxID=3075434 RepID=A0ABU3SE27_9HYPH|nr:hypothetical protein [Bosea sp. ZW T0_25]MDU0343033.1 hypothetical protein [Bosea sp. ZW T0_25]
MIQDDLTTPPRDEDHFWEMAEENWRHAAATLHLHLQSREEALLADRYADQSVSCIRYRETDHDCRERYYDLGRGLLDRVGGLIEERKLTPEFIQLWGVLMFSFGHTVNYQWDDSPVLVAAKAAAASARRRNMIPQRRWLAHVLYPKAKIRGKRRDAEAYAIDLIERVIKQRGVDGFPASWFKSMLRKEDSKDVALKTPFDQHNFSVKEMRYARTLGRSGLPPIERKFLLSGKLG